LAPLERVLGSQVPLGSACLAIAQLLD